MGTTFNNAKPFLDAESSELRLNFVHQSIATNGIAMVIRKTPAKIRLKKEKLLKEDYFTNDIHDFLIRCVQGHCNIIVCGETGSGKTEFLKYLASHTKTEEKIITIEDTLELHLDKIFPQRDIVSMKTNNVASYSDVLVTCMRQNPKWILLSEVRSAEAVSAVRNSISSGHNILSTIHADKASAIPYRLYSLMETDLDVNQFLTTIYRYVQIGVHIKAYYSKEYGQFHREVDEVTEFYVDDDNNPVSHTIYRKVFGKSPVMYKPSAHLLEYLSNQNIDVSDIANKLSEDKPFEESFDSPEVSTINTNQANNTEQVNDTNTNAVNSSVDVSTNKTNNLVGNGVDSTLNTITDSINNNTNAINDVASNQVINNVVDSNTLPVTGLNPTVNTLDSNSLNNPVIPPPDITKDTVSSNNVINNGGLPISTSNNVVSNGVLPNTQNTVQENGASGSIGSNLQTLSSQPVLNIGELS